MISTPVVEGGAEGGSTPEFDNLYLDMNSILHTATHTNDSSINRMTDDQMYAAIFTYIEHLFQIIKPQKTFYMAIDGVAPRAKMNQQRARRFRTAIEAEENLAKAIQQGQEIPKEDPFDSNAITPGTEFMAKLTDNLKYFIHKKISEDKAWNGVQIILSGHEVPGEGEHKIMDFIRTMKSQNNYNPNTRHCIYGLDADLIMLGLVSHDPHFALLREEVTFGPKRQTGSQSGSVSDQKFFLLHLSLLREYLELEFQDLENELNFEFNFEKVLDDFILIMYVIGNDFLPNLPDLFINKGAFPLLIETFKQYLKASDGYLNEEGTINLKRLSVWLTYLSEFELENFEKADVDVEWFNKKLEDISITGEKKRERFGKLLILKDQKKLIGFIKNWLLEQVNRPITSLLEEVESNGGELKGLKLPSNNGELVKNLEFLRQFALEVGLIIVHSQSKDTYEARLDIDGVSPYETEEEFNNRITETRKVIKKYQSANLIETEEVLAELKNIYDAKFMAWKDKYYKEKLHFLIKDEDKMVEFTKHYLEGLQWVLYYYYKGCPSWNWYYKYHYSPRISDIAIGLNYMLEHQELINFELSHPFKPFEQLMAVLPARSRNLMPLVYRPLMTEPQSPIIDFYPNEVDIDMNGKTASWEAVVLLSFVDEKRLIETLKPVEQKLEPFETKRNSFGKDILFILNPQVDYVYPSPLPGFFHDLEHDKCIEETFILPPRGENLLGTLPTGVLLGKEALAGFPTLHTLDFDYKLRLNETLVFQQPSRSESMVLNIQNRYTDLTVEQFSRKQLDRLVYAKWPFLAELKVISVSDGEFKWEIIKTQGNKKVISTPLDVDELKRFNQTRNSIKSSYLKTKGVNVGDVEALVTLKPVSGLFRNSNGAKVKTFSKDTITVPLQLIIEDVVNKDPRFIARAPLPIEEEFPLDSQVVFLGAFAYGTPATAVGFTGQDKLNVKISKIQAESEPNIGKERYYVESREIVYLPSFEVSKRLKLNPLLLSKLTSTFTIEDKGGKRMNIGLELKFEGRKQKVLGFTRKQNVNSKIWEFSPLAIKLINDYRTKFSSVFQKLVQLKDFKAIPKWTELFKSEEELTELRKWLKELRSQLITVSLELDSLTKFSVEAIENYMISYAQQPLQFSNKDIRGVPRDAVINPGESYQLLSTQRFELGDRVIYVQASGKVPYLSKGTVVGITSFGTKVSLLVVFDLPLLSGNTMNGRLKTTRGMVVDSSLVLNITLKQLVYHSKASKDKPQQRLQQRKPQAAKKATNNEKAANKGSAAPTGTQAAPVETVKHEKKAANELLSLLKGGKGAEENASPTDDDLPRNPNAIKQIYGQIYSNVMSEGYQQAPPPQFMQPPPQFAPQFQGAPQQVPQQVPSQYQGNENAPKKNGSETNGRGGHSIRGRGRGGNYRGRGRGKGKPTSE